MIPEILLLRVVWEENRRLWRFSFPFHFGLYLMIVTYFLLLIGAILMCFGMPVSAGNGGVNSLIYYVTIIVGVSGMIGGVVGTAGLLCRRLTAPELKHYSSFADYFNLVFLFSFCGSALLAWLFHDLSLDGARAHVYGLLTFGGLPRGYILDRSFLGGLTIVLTSLVLAYIPLTHMSHMFMKYFLYHFVRWEDEPNLKGSGLEASILQNLGFRPTWGASHIGADGKKTWGEIASSKLKELK
jgi:nitrate reductase gamma subunit